MQVIESLDELPAETPVVAIVNLAGAAILGGRWSARRKAALLASRLEVTRGLCALIARLHRRPDVLVSASAVGFYGVREAGAELDETAPPQPGRFQSDLCAAWEAQACAASALGVRVVRLRFGVVLGRGGGLFPGLALASRLGAGAVLGSGRQPVAWIHLADALGIIRLATDRLALVGAVNAVAPHAPPQAEFAAVVAASVGARARLRIPAWLPRLAAGEAAELLLEGQAATPRRALAAGYRFLHPRLEEAAADLATVGAPAARTGRSGLLRGRVAASPRVPPGRDAEPASLALARPAASVAISADRQPEGAAP